MGGHGFHQSLFNTQRDNYAFARHYRTETATLSHPPELHQYHRNGFPWLIGFVDGAMRYSGVSIPYEIKFDIIADSLWPDREVEMIPVGPYRMAEQCFQRIDTTVLRTIVVPDGDTTRLEEYRQAVTEGVSVKYESELVAEDLQYHLQFEGVAEDFSFETFEGRHTPFTLTENHIRMGDYGFELAAVAVLAAFPNPHNSSKYVALRLHSAEEKSPDYRPWADFAVATEKPGGEFGVVLDGFFDKSDETQWRFSDSLTQRYANLTEHCKGGVCPPPPSELLSDRPREYHEQFSAWLKIKSGQTITLGNGRCRLPDIAAGPNGRMMVVWEEDSDIIAAELFVGRAPKMIRVEGRTSESYDPHVVWDGQAWLVVYLNDRDGPWRLRGRYIDHGRPGAEMQLSGPGSFDVVTPDLVADEKGAVYASWTQWKALLRIPIYRRIVERRLDSIQSWPYVPTKGMDDYTNAWHVQLFAAAGEIWGAWNQHYPVPFGVCATRLGNEPGLVIEMASDPDETPISGYGDMVVTPEGRRWVVWETNGRQAIYGDGQQILAAWRDDDTSAWSSPLVVSSEDGLRQNQTPQAAVGPDGIIRVVYSSRGEGDDHWQVRMSVYRDDSWRPSERLSALGENACAPRIEFDSDGTPWICWHSGRGNKMVIRVVRLSP